MPTAAVAGLLAKVLISTDGGTNYISVGQLKDANLNIKADLDETTNHDSGGWKEFLPTNKEWSIDGEAVNFEGEAGQEAVITTIVAGTVVKLEWRSQTGTGKRRWRGDALVESWGLSGPTNGHQSTKISFKGTGAITPTNQP